VGAAEAHQRDLGGDRNRVERDLLVRKLRRQWPAGGASRLVSSFPSSVDPTAPAIGCSASFSTAQGSAAPGRRAAARLASAARIAATLAGSK
jgi:hypothetical protein